MVASAFHDYSNVLVPLPRIGGTGASPVAATPAAESTGKSNFQNVLASTVLKKDAPALKPLVQKSYGIDLPPKSNGLDLPRKTNGIPFTPDTATEESHKELMKACKDLESFFVGMLLKNMGKKLTEDQVFGGSYESSIYQDMFFSEITKSVADHGSSMGLAKTIFDDIILKSASPELPTQVSENLLV
jgi:hypothetical protein